MQQKQDAVTAHTTRLEGLLAEISTQTDLLTTETATIAPLQEEVALLHQAVNEEATAPLLPLLPLPLLRLPLLPLSVWTS